MNSIADVISAKSILKSPLHKQHGLSFIKWYESTYNVNVPKFLVALCYISRNVYIFRWMDYCKTPVPTAL